ncbi:MAG TPA: OsmC family protein [Ignavibacteriaceae bacterium]|nr:OsmC family protein [Ignavibacteriaceae bacterium]
MPVRKASAQWSGNLMEGKGVLNTETGVLKNTAYNAKSRFETGNQTNPEEILGAAHAGCFSMALANSLAKAGFKVNSIETEDFVHLEKTDDGFTITRIDINTVAEIEGIDDSTFQKHAADTKKGCPVSKALKSVEMILDAKLK